MRIPDLFFKTKTMTTLEEDVNKLLYLFLPELDKEKIEYEKRKKELMYKIRRDKRKRKFYNDMENWLKWMAFTRLVVVPITLLVVWWIVLLWCYFTE